MATFTCDTCNHTKATFDNHIGKSAKCPKCGGRGNITADDSPPVEMPDDVYAPAHTESPVAERVPEPPPQPEFSPEHGRFQPAFAPSAPKAIIPPPEVLKLPTWAAIVIRLSYLLLGMFTLGGLALFILSIGNATGAPQEAAAGAVFSALFIAGYILARCIEKMVRATVRM